MQGTVVLNQAVGNVSADIRREESANEVYGLRGGQPGEYGKNYQHHMLQDFYSIAVASSLQICLKMIWVFIRVIILPRLLAWAFPLHLVAGAVHISPFPSLDAALHLHDLKT